MKKVVEKIRQIDINSLVKFGMALGALFAAWLTLNLKVEHMAGQMNMMDAVTKERESSSRQRSREQSQRISKVEDTLEMVAEAQHKLSESQLVTAQLLQQHLKEKAQ